MSGWQRDEPQEALMCDALMYLQRWRLCDNQEDNKQEITTIGSGLNPLHMIIIRWIYSRYTYLSLPLTGITLIPKVHLQPSALTLSNNGYQLYSGTFELLYNIICLYLLLNQTFRSLYKGYFLQDLIVY